MAIMEQTSLAQGAWSDEMENPKAQLRILNNRLQMIPANFGSLFIPVLQRVLPYLQAFVSLIGDAVNGLMSFFGILGVDVDRNLSGLKGGLKQFKIVQKV